jgi:hypothetical protein
MVVAELTVVGMLVVWVVPGPVEVTKVEVSIPVVDVEVITEDPPEPLP